MQKLAIYGAGGFGREVLAMVARINAAHADEPHRQYDVVGFFDDGIARGTLVNNVAVLGGIGELCVWEENLCVCVAIGNPEAREEAVEKIGQNPLIEFPSLIHPSVIIGDSRWVTIGSGSIVCAGVIITTNVEIGRFVILNLQCTVGHDTWIGDYAAFMPSVNISGEVEVGRSVYVGTGARIINRLSIGTGAIVGAGAVVARSLPENCTAVGVPAKVIKQR